MLRIPIPRLLYFPFSEPSKGIVAIFQNSITNPPRNKKEKRKKKETHTKKMFRKERKKIIPVYILLKSRVSHELSLSPLTFQSARGGGRRESWRGA